MDFASEEESPVSRVEVIPLGAGRDIGRSCVVVKFYLASSKPACTVVFDCGLHVGHDDPEQCFPDFSQLDLAAVDCFLISHIHIDHCGALPQLTERHRFSGPIFMSAPTKALLPRMLEDQLRNRGFSAREVQASVAKCIELEHRRTYWPRGGGSKELQVKMFRAGHVLGAVMFLVTFHGRSVLYTGDYNATPDRHLGAYEQIGPERVDVLITESTYGTTTRGSALGQEREFLDQVTRSLVRGGKVLVPTYALGRVPEMLSLLEAHWKRMNFSFKILLCTREAAGVSKVYDEYANWGSSRELPAHALLGYDDDEVMERHVAQTSNSSSFVVVGRDPTEEELHGPEPLVLIATSAMLAGGISLKAFRAWGKGEKNAVIFPGACVRGTLGNRLLTMQIPGELEGRPVRCQVSIAAFNAHTDCKGILQLVHQTRPREQIVLVHGVQVQMEALKRRMERELAPALNGKISFPENLQVLRIDLKQQQDVARAKRQRRICEVELSSRTLPTTARRAFPSVDDFCRAAQFMFRERVVVVQGEEFECRSLRGGFSIASGDYLVTLLWDGNARVVTVRRSYIVQERTTLPAGEELVPPKWVQIAEQVAADL